MRYILLTIILFCSLSNVEAQRSKKFTPVYGNDSEINRTLTFVTDNLIFDSLTYARLGHLEGFVRCTFNVDTSGKIVDVRIARGLAPWVDYEILAAMNSLPAMEPFLNKKGVKIKVSRDVFFTFNGDDSGFNNSWEGHQNVTEQATQSIDEQRLALANKLAKSEKEWMDFVKDNTKLSHDGKGIYKPGVLPQNPLKTLPPPTRPPITVTIKSE